MDSHPAKMTSARGAPKCTRASQLIPLCLKQHEFNTARSTTFERRAADTSPDASRRHRRASTFTHAARRSVHRARTRGFGLDASPRGIQIAFHIT
jgi:hypothetical protein